MESSNGQINVQYVGGPKFDSISKSPYTVNLTLLTPPKGQAVQ